MHTHHTPLSYVIQNNLQIMKYVTIIFSWQETEMLTKILMDGKYEMWSSHNSAAQNHQWICSFFAAFQCSLEVTELTKKIPVCPLYTQQYAFFFSNEVENSEVT